MPNGMAHDGRNGGNPHCNSRRHRVRGRMVLLEWLAAPASRGLSKPESEGLRTAHPEVPRRVPVGHSTAPWPYQNGNGTPAPGLAAESAGATRDTCEKAARQVPIPEPCVWFPT
jgi:hypothetical protein